MFVDVTKYGKAHKYHVDIQRAQQKKYDYNKTSI